MKEKARDRLKKLGSCRSSRAVVLPKGKKIDLMMRKLDCKCVLVFACKDPSRREERIWKNDTKNIRILIIKQGSSRAQTVHIINPQIWAVLRPRKEFL